MTNGETITPPAFGAVLDPVSMMWEGYAKGEFIGLFGSEEDACKAVRKECPHLMVVEHGVAYAPVQAR